MQCFLVLIFHNLTLAGVSVKYLSFVNGTLTFSLTLPNPCYQLRLSNYTLLVNETREVCAQVIFEKLISIELMDNATLKLKFNNASLTVARIYRFCHDNVVTLSQLLEEPRRYSNETLKLKLLYLGFSRPVNLPGPGALPLTKCDSAVTDGTAWLYAKGPLCVKPREVVARAKLVLVSVRGRPVPYLVIEELSR